VKRRREVIRKPHRTPRKLTHRLQREINELLNVHEVAEMFDRTTMTISLWRRQQNMPTLTMQQGGRTIHRFVPRDVKLWAKAAGKTIVTD
jgi:hypothetical protein